MKNKSAQRYNARLASQGKRGIKWIVDLSGGMRLVSTRGAGSGEQHEFYDDGKPL